MNQWKLGYYNMFLGLHYTFFSKLMWLLIVLICFDSVMLFVMFLFFFTLFDVLLTPYCCRCDIFCLFVFLKYESSLFRLDKWSSLVCYLVQFITKIRFRFVFPKISFMLLIFFKYIFFYYRVYWKDYLSDVLYLLTLKDRTAI